jgi:hypothetical protein
MRYSVVKKLKNAAASRIRRALVAMAFGLRKLSQFIEKITGKKDWLEEGERLWHRVSGRHRIRHGRVICYCLQ